MSKDFIPSNNGDLYTLGEKVTNGVSADLVKYGIVGAITNWYNSEYIPSWNKFGSDYLQWKDPTTRLTAYSISVNNSKDKYTPYLRQLNNLVRNNPTITDEDLYSLGLPPRPDSKPTPAPIPATIPEANIESKGSGVLNIHFRDKGATNKAKPAGVHGVEIRWGILANKPETRDELTNSAFDTKTPYQFVFKESQRGQRMYFSLRWENTRGEKGNWSDIYDTIIP